MEFDSGDYDAKWNFDFAESIVLFNLKTTIAEYLDQWKLDEAYWKLRSLRREVDAILKRGRTKIEEEQLKEQEKMTGKKKLGKTLEKEAVDEKLEELTQVHTEYIAIPNPTDEEKIAFYTLLEEFYLLLCYFMRIHQLYFSEGNRGQGGPLVGRR